MKMKKLLVGLAVALMASSSLAKTEYTGTTYDHQFYPLKECGTLSAFGKDLQFDKLQKAKEMAELDKKELDLFLASQAPQLGGNENYGKVIKFSDVFSKFILTCFIEKVNLPIYLKFQEDLIKNLDKRLAYMKEKNMVVDSSMTKFAKTVRANFENVKEHIKYAY